MIQSFNIYVRAQLSQILTEEQIQIIEKELNIKRQMNPDGTCVFGNKNGNGCGPNTVLVLLNVCKYHADLYGGRY